MEAEKLHGNLIDWQFEQLDDRQIDEVLWCVPDEESRTALRAKSPSHHGLHSLDLDRSRLIWDSLEKAYSQLETIRNEGLVTHAAGHAAAYLFNKVLSMFHREHIHSPSAFRKRLDQDVERVKAAFEPVFKVLLINFKAESEIKDEKKSGRAASEIVLYEYTHMAKWEKQTLLRAQWPTFSKVWNEFVSHDWHNEYKALFNYALSRIKTPQQGLKHPELNGYDDTNAPNEPSDVATKDPIASTTMNAPACNTSRESVTPGVPPSDKGAGGDVKATAGSVPLSEPDCSHPDLPEPQKEDES